MNRIVYLNLHKNKNIYEDTNDNHDGHRIPPSQRNNM